jgi:5'(3')-deoxyribonucleotidase
MLENNQNSQAFSSQKLAQFFTFFSRRHFRLKNIYNFQILLSEKTFYTENFKIFQVLFENTICIEKKRFFQGILQLDYFILREALLNHLY